MISRPQSLHKEKVSDTISLAAARGGSVAWNGYETAMALDAAAILDAWNRLGEEILQGA